NWNSVTNSSTLDWIGFFQAVAPDTNYLDFRWSISCSTTPCATPKAAGSCSIAMPAAAGTYELRLFSNSTFMRLASSGPITVTARSAERRVGNPRKAGGACAGWANKQNVTKPRTLYWNGRFEASP